MLQCSSLSAAEIPLMTVCPQLYFAERGNQLSKVSEFLKRLQFSLQKAIHSRKGQQGKAQSKKQEVKPTGHEKVQEDLGSQDRVSRTSILSTEKARRRVLRNVAVVQKLNSFLLFSYFLRSFWVVFPPPSPFREFDTCLWNLTWYWKTYRSLVLHRLHVFLDCLNCDKRLTISFSYQ